MWEPSEFGGKRYVALPVDKLWLPDTFITEMVDEDKSPMAPYLYVHYTGKIIYGKPLRIVSSCNLNILYFPFDIQKCSFVSCEVIFCELTMKRRPLFYVVNLLIPSSFLMLTDILSFYLPTHSFDRASFKMTLMLGYSVFLLIVKDLLPNNSAGTPLIAIYFVVCLTFMAVSLIETIFIINIVHEKTNQSRAIPKWLLPSTGCEDHTSELCSSPQLLTLQSLLRKIAEDVEGIKQHLDQRSQEQGLKHEWIRIGHILDCFLQSIYVLSFVIFALTLTGTWVM
uniref:Neurotransmitter-gated ion-channel ligand-binding domain-containing protein n=1 Tax=Callorhinchus milii TaxID=7868 RepID=A0A4W3JJR9_CALMI